uniref:hypothetical protein n=1 Tax=Thaumasiovibrio occultus TaxID=1891184 RepID=UPI00131D79FC|nr:hypothetical protein [Thaumasiovibrio occultus]
MSRIQNINMNKAEVKLAETDDPVASKINWDPAKPGGSIFNSQTMSVSRQRIRVKRSILGKLFYAFFFLPGLAIGLFIIPEYMQYGFDNVILMSLLFGSVVLFTGFGLLFVVDKPITFDKPQGIYFRGKKYDRMGDNDRNKQGRLADIYALQILTEKVQTTNRNGRSLVYSSYELNLVFEDGARVNVMDHGNANALEASAEQLADFLDVPVWKACR